MSESTGGVRGGSSVRGLGDRKKTGGVLNRIPRDQKEDEGWAQEKPLPEAVHGDIKLEDKGAESAASAQG